MKDNYCEIDPTTVDEFGIPVLRFNYQWTDYEQEAIQAHARHFEEICHNMGGIALGDKPAKIRITVCWTQEGSSTKWAPPVWAAIPRLPVVNEFERLHDVNNVFVVDAGPFVSQTDENPTWTILAPAWRTSDYIIEELKKQNL